MTESTNEPTPSRKIQKNQESQESQEDVKAKDSGQSKAKGKDRRMKLGFILVIVVVAIVIYSMQRKRETLTLSWMTDYDAALAKAQQRDTNIIVFITEASPTWDDQRTIEKCFNMQPAIDLLAELGWVRLHLTLPAAQAKAQQMGIDKTPAVVVLSQDGAVMKKNVGFINDVQLRTQFLAEEVEGLKQP